MTFFTDHDLPGMPFTQNLDDKTVNAVSLKTVQVVTSVKLKVLFPLN